MSTRIAHGSAKARWYRIAATVPVVGLLVGALALPATSSAVTPGATYPGTDGTLTALESDILAAVGEADFANIYDYNLKKTIGYTPQVDVAVIELDTDGNIRDRANILVSRDYPNGVVAPIDSNLSSSSVKWQKWDYNAFETDSYGSSAPILPGRDDAPLRYMATYPASVLKSMVAFGLVFLSDHGVVNVNGNYTYNGVTKPITQWTAEMIQYSNNTSAQAMIKYLHEVTYEGQTGIQFLNAEMQRLGMTTLQLQGTSAATGGGWANGGVTMTSFDTARLDLLLDGGNGGVLWKTPEGLDVTSDILSEAGRQWLLDIWSGSAFHWMLDTGNFCNWTTPYTGTRQYPAPGIPAVVPESTLNPNGTSKIQWAGSPFATVDIRPCNEEAEVTYYNKYGLTENAGADAGIVKNLAGKPFRHYIISVMTNIGYRYGDPELSALANPCLSNVSSFCYSEEFPILAGKIDAAIKARGEVPAKAASTTALELTASDVTYPAVVTAKATVTGAADGSVIEFFDGTTKVGEAPLTGGEASLPLTLLPGDYGLVARYGGDETTHVSTSLAAPLTVAKGDPELAVEVSATSFGDPVTVTANLRDNASGTVEFFQGETSLGVKDVTAGTATVEIPDLAVGAYPIAATYSGSAIYEPATVLTAVAVSKAGTVSTLSLTPAVYGKDVTATATISPKVSGEIEFSTATKSLGTVSVANGVAVKKISGLGAGSHTIIAKFLGADGYEQSFVVGVAQVAKAAPAKVTVKAKKFKKGKKPTVRVAVAKLTNGAYPVGSVKVRVAGKTVRTVKLKAAKKGKLTIKLPKKYKKAIKVKAIFVPSDAKNVKSKSSKAIKVKVKKK